MQLSMIQIFKMPPARGAQEIVYPYTILDSNTMLQENWNLIRLIPSIAVDKLQCLEWLARRRLVRNFMVCERCNGNVRCTLQRYAEGIDKYRWACACTFSASVRNDSFFMKSHLELHKIILMIYYWANQTPQKKASRELELGSNHTSVDWYNFCLDFCADHLLTHREPFGGVDFIDGEVVPKVVEIVESRFFHRGKWRGKVLGGIERKSNKCFLVEILESDPKTIEEIIQDWILPGSHIVSDGCSTYRNIKNIGGGIYTHEITINQDIFVDSDNPPVHTQDVENMWSRAKRMFKCTSKDLYDNYLVEFMWRSKFPENQFSNILCQTTDQYPP